MRAPASAGRLRVALAVVVRDGLILVQRRPRGSHLSGLWEFPGGKVQDGEAPPSAARRELAEETGLAGGRLTRLGGYRHDYPDRRVELLAYLLAGCRGEPWPASARWVTPDELSRLAMPAANRPIVRDLRRRLQRPLGAVPA